MTTSPRVDTPAFLPNLPKRHNLPLEVSDYTF